MRELMKGTTVIVHAAVNVQNSLGNGTNDRV